jgi:hypothetical protein
MAEKFHATLKISGNGFRIPDNLREWYNVILDECRNKNNGYASVTISRPRRIRSTGKGSQSHHLNGHIQQISAETGQPFADIKKYLKHEAITYGYPIMYNDKNEPLLDLWGEEQGTSETEASVEECALLIEEAHKLAAEHGIRLEEG